jgi:hypothetical protein
MVYRVICPDTGWNGSKVVAEFRPESNPILAGVPFCWFPFTSLLRSHGSHIGIPTRKNFWPKKIAAQLTSNDPGRSLTNAQIQAEARQRGDNPSENTANRKSLTPGRAIRKICIDCVGSAFEISDCQGEISCTTVPACFFRIEWAKAGHRYG